MPIEVTTRHMDAGQALQTYAEARAAVLCAEFPRIEHLHVILDAEKKRRIAHVVVQARRHVRMEMTGASENPRAAVDEAMGKLEKKLRRMLEKAKDHKPAMKRQKAIRDRARGAA